MGQGGCGFPFPPRPQSQPFHLAVKLSAIKAQGEGDMGEELDGLPAGLSEPWGHSSAQQQHYGDLREEADPRIKIGVLGGDEIRAARGNG